MTRSTKYDQIADHLRSQIADGTYSPGDRLPGEGALAREHGVAILTARHALRVLRTEGLAEGRRGAGVFVREPVRPIRRRGIQRLSRLHWETGASVFAADDDRPLTVDQVSIQTVSAPEHIRAVLDLPADTAVCARGRRFVLEGRPVLISTSYLPLALVEGTAIMRADTGPGGIYARLSEIGHAPAAFREEIRCRPPRGDEPDRLALSPGEPVIDLIRSAADSTGRVVEVNMMVLSSQHYVLEYAFSA